jgi:hypothetical protein
MSTEPSEHREASWFLVAAIITLVTVAPLNYVIEEEIVGPRLVDGTIVELGRYTFMYDAVDYLESSAEAKVIAIGSSKIREGFDGGLLAKESAARGVTFANLGVAADVPYFRMTNIEAIAELQPEVVVMELGPNSLSRLDSPLSQRDADRMNAMLYNRPIGLKEDYRDIIQSEDELLLQTGLTGRMLSKSSFGFEAFDDALSFGLGIEETTRWWDCSDVLSNVRCVPDVESKLFPTYLEYPPQFDNAIERYKAAGPETMEIFYGEKLDAYLARPSHHPEGVLNKNEQALEFIIDELDEAGVEILLLGLPYNPVLENRLAAGDWDYYNSTVERFVEDERVHMLDLMWDSTFDDDTLFNDYTHLSEDGEERLMQTIAPVVDDLLKRQGVSMLESHVYSAMSNVIHQEPETIYAAYLPANGTVHVNLSQPNEIIPGSGRFAGQNWTIDPDSGYLVSAPDADISQNGVLGSPRVDYCMKSEAEATYWVWIHLAPPGGRSDSVYLGLDGVLLDLGARGVQSWGETQQPIWRTVGDNGERIQFSSSSNDVCLSIWVREDGIVVRDLVLTTHEFLSVEA